MKHSVITRFVGMMLFGGAISFACRAATAVDALVVHEWGTFTALQDESGQALPGINVDDEPLPPFTHTFASGLLERANSLPAASFQKGVPQRHPYVTLRLETPVLYFHPSATEILPFSIDVNVKFRGGLLTEFYPRAEASVPGFLPSRAITSPITSGTMGQLVWRNVLVGTSGKGPASTEHVWVAPRAVNAANLTIPAQSPLDKGSESEKFLFYRGVGNRPAPVRVAIDPASGQATLSAQVDDVLSAGQSMKIDGAWLVHIRPDGTSAWKTVQPMVLTENKSAVLARIDTRFKDMDFSAGNFESLQQAMHQALIAQGLFDDEASAMLETWRHAYFHSAGLRLFFLVPRAWTDAVLPLQFSRPADVRRVMMGRVELITPEQRKLLEKLSSTKADARWMSAIKPSENAEKFFEGRSDFGDLGTVIPADYQTYLDLGRFRNALVLAEQKTRPTADLGKFISTYGLMPYVVK